MKIVVLDAHTLNPGDLSWDDLRELGDCEIHDRTAPAQTVPRARGAEVALTNKTVLDRATLEQLADLRYLGVLATGYDVVDVGAARERGITVCNVPAYASESVAQMVFAHLLNLTQRVADHSRGARAGRWAQSVDFSYWEYPLVELGGLTMGLVGLGRTGRAVARLARAFGMNVLAHDPYAEADEEGVEAVSVDELFCRSDVLSLHCPLTDETRGLVNAGRLAQMKPSAFLINTSRGPVVDEGALAEALNEGRIAGAGVDVLSKEPPQPDNPLLSAANCFVTPHIAWATRSSRKRLLNTAVENLRAFLAGRPQNVVS